MKRKLVLLVLALYVIVSVNAQGIISKDSAVVDKEAQINEVHVTGYKRIEQSNAQMSVFQLNTKLPKKTKAEIAICELPGILRDEKGFKLAGNERASKLLIDGMDATLDEVKSLNASEIEKVEVKHLSIEGNEYDGEINIIRKKRNDMMLNGELGLSSGTVRSNYGIIPRLSFQNSRIDLMGMADITYHRYGKDINVKRVLSTGNEQMYLSNGTTGVWQKFASLRSNCTFSSSVSAMFSYVYMGHDVEVDEKTKNLDESNGEINRNEIISNHFINAVVRFSQNDNSRLFIKGRFHHYGNTNDVEQLSSVVYKVRMNEYSAEVLQEADSLKLLGKWHKMNIGVKGISRSNNLSGSDEGRSNILIAYFGDYFKLSDRLSIDWHLRTEWAHYKMQNSSYHESSLLPSFSLNYKLSRGKILLTGERYVIRPSVDYLNPAVFYSNEVFKDYGNPDLKAEYNNQFKLKYSRQIKNAQIGLSASYLYISDIIDRVYVNDYNNRTYQNAGYGNVTSFSAALMKPFLDYRITLNAVVQASYYDYRLSSAMDFLTQSLGNAGWGYGMSLNINYVSTKEWFFNLNGSFNRDSRDMSSTQTQYPSVNCSVEKSFFNERLTISTSWLQALGTKSHQEIRLRGAWQKVDTNTYMSNVILSLRWNFGKKLQRRSVGSVITNDDISTKE